MTKTEITVGKVKTIFSTDKPDEVIIQYEDRVTAGNGKKELWVENKGAICCEISELLFKKMEEAGIKTHYVSMPTHRAMCCKKVEIVPIEVVVRNVCAGSIVRQTTLEEGKIINWPLVEWYLKDDEKDDPLLTTDRILLMGYGQEVLQEMGMVARDVNYVLKNIFRKIGLTLVDFKLEFGYDSEQNLLLADELSPDGMRLWKQGTKESFDKDLFRNEKGDMIGAYKYVLTELRKLDE
jgi:phosphoribosylaminoimidazole-succinocarboxamide synthase